MPELPGEQDVTEEADEIFQCPHVTPNSHGAGQGSGGRYCSPSGQRVTCGMHNAKAGEY